MTDKTTLGDRMKQYESTTQTSLLRRTPVIIRIDGRAFHTFTKRLVSEKQDRQQILVPSNRIVDPSLNETPFSQVMHHLMTLTTATLFNQVQNCVFAYTQSDEISLVLKDWDRHETQQWFGGNVQKICSLSASIATAAFNYHLMKKCPPSTPLDFAQFDSRVYNVPHDEVVNYMIWRQQDASRNSVQMLGRFHFSQKEMHGKSNSQVQDMLMLNKGVNWNDLPVWMKRGSAVYQRADWNEFMSFYPAHIDDNIPIFTQDRAFIEKHLAPKDTLGDLGDFRSEIGP